MNESVKQESGESADQFTDSHMVELLNDAFSAGAVPHSLLARIDRAVTVEWGVSPQLVDAPLSRWSGPVMRAGSRMARIRRSLPVAGVATLVLVLGVLLSWNSPSYAWAAVLDALERHGVVEITENGTTHWLALADGVSGTRTSASVRLIDVREQVLLVRSTGSNTVQRYRLQDIDRNALALNFLCNTSTGSHFDPATPAPRLLQQTWKTIQTAGGEQIALSMSLACADRTEPLNVTLRLDPHTSLPMTVDVGDDNPRELKVSSSTVSRLRAEQFPADMTIVDVAPGDLAGTRFAELPLANDQPGRPDIPAVSETNLTAKVTAPVAADNQGEPALFRAPSQWSPVVPIARKETEVVQQADAILAKLWSEQQVVPAEPADESELLRRVYLDLVGRTPSVTEVRHWLNDQSPDRYEALVDRLLNSPDHASHMATVWRSFLIPEGVDLQAFGGVRDFDRWLTERFSDNVAYDETVRALLLAEGRLSRSGPLLFYSALKLDPDQLAARTSRVFLGMRMECAQCHDHPFEPWTQKEFWGFAAFFARISRPQTRLESVSTVMQVRDVDRGEVMLPESETVISPSFLDGAALPENAAGIARRQQLAEWLTGPRNPYFARATANRVWGLMFGKGIVDPVDDFGTQHQPTSPELLDLLAGHFIGTRFNLKELFRTVALTRAYRLSSGAETEDDKRLKLFAQMNVKTLTAEQVYDCITVATMLDAPVTGPDGFNLIDRISDTSRDEFIAQFRTPAGRNTEYLGGIPQSLTLMNGGLISGATGLSTSGLLKSLEAPFFTNAQRVEVLYLATLSRKPRPSELEVLKDYIPEGATGQALSEGLADILWALLNSAEFTLNH